MIWGLLTIASAATLTGTITDADGQPVDNAFVIIYDSRFQFEFEQTGPDGVFRVEDLPADRYRVRVLPPSSDDSAEVWAGGALGACNAPPFVVDEDAVQVVDVALSEGARLTGRILVNGQPAQGVRVTARTQRTGLVAQNRFDFTDVNGNYIIRGITPDQDGVGVYAVEAQVLEFPTQFLPGVYSAEQATTVELAGGDAEVMPDFELRPGVSVSGTVSGPQGGVDGGQVVAFSSGQSVTAPIAGGQYTARGMRPGDVLVWAYADGLATSYYPSSPTPGERISLPEDGDRAFGIDLVLPAESVLQSQLAGGPFEGSSVLVFNTEQTSAVSGEVDETGAFSVGTLHPNDYLLFVDGVADGFVEDFVRDADGEPEVFTVSGVTDVGIVQVPLGAVIEGVVRNRHTDEPVYGVAIIAEGTRTGERRTAITDRDGVYRIEGMFADRWQVRAEYQPPCQVDPSYVPTYYPDQRNPTFSTVIDLSAGTAVTWDAGIGPDVDRDGMDDVWEAENGLDPTVDDGNLDLDGDGFSNRDEYLLGTDPNDSDDVIEQPKDCGCSHSGSGGLAWLVGMGLLLVTRRKS